MVFFYRLKDLSTNMSPIEFNHTSPNHECPKPFIKTITFQPLPVIQVYFMDPQSPEFYFGLPLMLQNRRCPHIQEYLLWSISQFGMIFMTSCQHNIKPHFFHPSLVLALLELPSISHEIHEKRHIKSTKTKS